MKLFFVTFQAGHWVTVYERNDRCGGLLMYGVPPMKLSKKVDQASLDIVGRNHGCVCISRNAMISVAFAWTCPSIINFARYFTVTLEISNDSRLVRSCKISNSYLRGVVGSAKCN